MISGGAFKEIVETEINVGRMDSMVYLLNGFVISYADDTSINFWNNYIAKFNMLMAAYCVESMNLTMQELSHTYYRKSFTGKDYNNVFLSEYNRVMNLPIVDLYIDDIIWASPYTMLRIKEEIG